MESIFSFYIVTAIIFFIVLLLFIGFNSQEWVDDPGCPPEFKDILGSSGGVVGISAVLALIWPYFLYRILKRLIK